VAAAENDRRKIAADIHDDSIQVMTAAGMRLQILRKALDSPEQIRRLSEVEQTIHLSIVRLRRLIFELRPAALDLEGLASALRSYAEGSSGQGGSCEVVDLLAGDPPEEIRVILYRIGQEVLSNVRKHASATHVKITLAPSEGGYLITIADDGVGFEAGKERLVPGSGLATARERAELLGGRLEVESAPGSGTTVEYWLPGNGA
jgi:signal transduction histidine kinase